MTTEKPQITQAARDCAKKCVSLCADKYTDGYVLMAAEIVQTALDAYAADYTKSKNAEIAKLVGMNQANSNKEAQADKLAEALQDSSLLFSAF